MGSWAVPEILLLTSVKLSPYQSSPATMGVGVGWSGMVGKRQNRVGEAERVAPLLGLSREGGGVWI